MLVSQDIAWKYAHDGNIPPQAMVVGHTASGEKLYLGRAYHEGTITPGKVQLLRRSQVSKQNWILFLFDNDISFDTFNVKSDLF